MLFKRVATSIISGSRAAFSMTVRPLANRSNHRVNRCSNADGIHVNAYHEVPYLEQINSYYLPHSS